MPKTVNRHKAPQIDRDMAAYWSGLYRQAQASPDKRIRLADGYVVLADDTEFLITLLETFGKFGTFQAQQDGLTDMVTLLAGSLKFQSLVNAGIPVQQAKQSAVKIAGSASTFRRLKIRVLGRNPDYIKEKTEKKERIKARRQSRLTPLEDVFGIRHPKG